MRIRVKCRLTSENLKITEYCRSILLPVVRLSPLGKYYWLSMPLSLLGSQISMLLDTLVPFK